MDDFAKSIKLKEELDAVRPLSQEDEKRIMDKFRLDLNYHSNHLEGNSLTYGEIKALILYNITAEGKPLKDHFEMNGHNEAVKWVLDIIKDDRKLTENYIREIHKLILKKPYETDAISVDGTPLKKLVKIGEYKTTDNHVKTKTGEIFRFATAEETPAKMNDLLAWYHAELANENVNPILLAAEFHYKYIRIHPFDDGNGRTARILMNFILMKFGYPPVIIKTEDKANYFAALQQADAGVLTPFVNYINSNLIDSLKIMISGAKGEEIEEPDDVDKEIALLRQRFERDEKYFDLVKSGVSLQSSYTNVISKFIDEIILQSQKLGEFYFEFGYTTQINQKTNNFTTGQFINGNEEEVKNRFFELVDTNTAGLHFKFTYNILKKLKQVNTNYDEDLIVNFQKFKYSIMAGIYNEYALADSVTILECSYSDIIENEQAKEYIKEYFTKPHLEFIKQTLDGS